MNHVFDNKESIRIVLAPMFELLLYKRQKLSHEEWLAFVARTESSIIQSPQQFLGNDLPSKSIIDGAVKEIFMEFLEKETVETAAEA
jgi:hypothetical protein